MEYLLSLGASIWLLWRRNNSERRGQDVGVTTRQKKVEHRKRKRASEKEHLAVFRGCGFRLEEGENRPTNIGQRDSCDTQIR